MKTLFFKEISLEELNSHGTDFWVGAGVVAAGAGVASVLILT
ncbi:hypothetical protein [Bacillus cereus]|nr:hypothetical protein [Bacillus cereus]